MIKLFLSAVLALFCLASSAQGVLRAEVSPGVYSNVMVTPVSVTAGNLMIAQSSINTNTVWLPSAARTTSQTMADQINTGARGIIAYCNVTVAPGIETVLFKVQGKDPLSGVYFDLAVPTATALAGLVTVALVPNLAAVAASAAGVTAANYLPYTWRLVATHSAAGSWTYSCSYSSVW